MIKRNLPQKTELSNYSQYSYSGDSLKFSHKSEERRKVGMFTFGNVSWFKDVQSSGIKTNNGPANRMAWMCQADPLSNDPN